MLSYARRLKSYLDAIRGIDRRLDAIQQSLGRVEARQARAGNSPNMGDHEFRVYSQFGEDGIIQHLVRHVPIENRTFVEFGVESYVEANTRFLLVNDNWSGLVIDGSEANVASIKADPIYWRHNLKVERAFITRENINTLLSSNGVTGDIGLLSVDIDGNDYWVWKEISVVSPRIVVVEYNSRFGEQRAVTVPYDPAFTRQKAHSSMVYFGASLRALVQLGAAKGYAFVGCGRHGINAFFVRSDLLTPPLRQLTVEEGFIAAQFRESRNVAGELAFLAGEQERAILRDLPLVDVTE